MNAHSRLDRPLDVDSTQTMRALSETELYDSHQQRWFAVQLVISDRPINLDMMPRLEAFAAHQLYALVAKHETGTWHALRLGFFPDEQSAEALCEHLRTYFSAATIVRVSVAEQTRFAPRTAAAAPVQSPAAPSATTPAASPAVPRPQVADTAVKATAPHLQTRKNKTLAQELLEEAREVQLARSGKKQAPAQSSSWITRLFGRPSERPRAAGRR
jgi:SPOR domain